MRLGRIGGMEVILAAPGFVVASVALLIAFMAIGIAFSGRGLLNVAVGALVLVALHWFNETWHNYGHFRAARSTGFPMDGVKLGTALLVFGTSVYPADEPELPAGVHLRRALGGPIANLALGAVGAVVTIVMAMTGSHFLWVGIVFTLENVLVFGIGNALPLGFNDGSTVLYWLRRR